MGVAFVTVGFLVIGCIVLDGSSDTVALDAVHIGSCNLSRYERIFREILEIAAAKHIPVYIHSSNTSTPNSRTSLPIAFVTSSTSSVFQVVASAVPTGNAVA